jgi:hypothetical protein
MGIEETLAKELADVVKTHVREQITPLRVQLDALAARVNGLEAANSLRGNLDELKGRLDRIERAKAAVVRLPRSGSAA